MSAPNSSRPAVVGVTVGVVVLAVVALVWALRPVSATATAQFTVTPRTADGADAALLLADRYAALAGSPATLRAARDSDPQLADVRPNRLADGTRVDLSPAGATITVQVTLPDAGTAAAAANAVVGALVAAGEDEELVEVDQVVAASAGRAEPRLDVLPWAVAGLLLALCAGLATAALTARVQGRRSAATAPPAATPGPQPGAGPPFLHDDLPGFLEAPPGAPPPAPLGRPAPAANVPVAQPAASVNGHRPGPVPVGRRVVAPAVVTALVLGAAAAGFALGRERSLATAPVAVPAPPPAPAPTSTAPPPEAAPPPAAGDLAFASVPLGEDGVAASVVFGGVLLEQRAVGLTVTYPAVSLTTDGERALAHVRLPTFNCLTDEPPADPLAAGCARSVTEYADLAGPALQLSRDGDRIELAGLFPTYTRPNGSAPAYTGRAYQLSAAVTAEGTERDGRAPAAGVVRIGLDSAATAADRGVNLLQFPG